MQLEFSWQFLKNTHILNSIKSQNVPYGCTDRWTDRQRQTGRQTDMMKPVDTFCILHVYLNSKYGVKVVRANVTEVMFFLTVEVVGFTPDCIVRFVK